MVSFAAFQGAIALVFLFRGETEWWEASVPWWPMVAVMTNILTLALLVCLMRQEGRHWWSLFKVDVVHLWRDLAVVLGLAVVTAILVIVPNFGLATLLFGDAEAPLDTFVQPLPVWAALVTFVLFPLTIALTELPTYFGYLQPRLEVLTRRAWAAVALSAGFFSLQHATLPLVFEWRFIAWRGLMFLPFTVFLALILRWRPRLLLYFAVLHGLADFQIAQTIFNASL